MTEPLILRRGAHSTRDEGMCAMEAVAYIAGEPHSDSPECACPVIAAFVRRWNDDLPDDATRTRLLGPLVPRLVGTRSTPDVERRRSLLALDWLVREHTPAWLDLTPALADHAAALRALPEIVDTDTAQHALPVVDAAGEAARDAWAAAWSAVRNAAWAVSAIAARNPAWAATEAASRVADGVVAEAALEAAWDAAGVAALAAARAAPRAATAWAAGWAPAMAALAPTTARLHESALRLVERMIAVSVGTFVLVPETKH